MRNGHGECGEFRERLTGRLHCSRVCLHYHQEWSMEEGREGPQQTRSGRHRQMAGDRDSLGHRRYRDKARSQRNKGEKQGKRLNGIGRQERKMVRERQGETEEKVQGHREREAETGNDGKTQEQRSGETHTDPAAGST